MVGADLRAALRERLRLASRVFTSFGRDHGFQGRAGTRFFMGGMASVPSHFSPCFLLLLRHRNDQPDGTEGTKSRKAFLQILVGEPGRTEDRGLGRPRHDVKRAGSPVGSSKKDTNHKARNLDVQPKPTDCYSPLKEAHRSRRTPRNHGYGLVGPDLRAGLIDSRKQPFFDPKGMVIGHFPLRTKAAFADLGFLANDKRSNTASQDIES